MSWLTDLFRIGKDAAPLVGGIVEAVSHPSAQTIGDLMPGVIGIVEQTIKAVQSSHDEAVGKPLLPGPLLDGPTAITIPVVEGVPHVPASLIFTNDFKKNLAVSLATFGIQALFGLRGHSTPKFILDGLPNQIERSLATLKYLSGAIAAAQEAQ